jgi:hypothetical protein
MCRTGLRVDVLFTDINLNGIAEGWQLANALRVPPSESYTHSAIQSIDPSVFKAVYISRSPTRGAIFWQHVVV